MREAIHKVIRNSILLLTYLTIILGSNPIFANHWDFGADVLYLQPDLDSLNIRGI